MFPYLSAVTPQIAYAHSVREFIRDLLKRFMPGKWIDRVISGNDEKFSAKLDAAFADLDEKTATEKDYCVTVVSVFCDEVSEICDVTRLVCANRGYDEYAAKYLSSEKFIRLLLRQDTAKLKRLNAAMSDASKPLCVLLREIGAVLEDKSTGGGEAFGAAEIKKANAALKAIAADVKKAIATGFSEVKRDIAAVGEKVDEVDRKVSKLRGSGKPRGRYTQKAKAVCWSCWTAAANHEEIWRSVNTRITYKAVFDYYHARLAQVGVNDHNAFRDVIHAEVMRRNRELSARQNTTRYALTTTH